MEQPIKLLRTLYITDILNYNIHLGTNAKKTNSKMRPFIMGKYHEYAIINIFKTYVHLFRIKLFLIKIIITTGNSNVLFISTDRLLAPVIEKLANMSTSSYINDVCKGGILTNFKFVSKRKKKKSASWKSRSIESKNIMTVASEIPELLQTKDKTRSTTDSQFPLLDQRSKEGNTQKLDYSFLPSQKRFHGITSPNTERPGGKSDEKSRQKKISLLRNKKKPKYASALSIAISSSHQKSGEDTVQKNEEKILNSSLSIRSTENVEKLEQNNNDGKEIKWKDNFPSNTEILEPANSFMLPSIKRKIILNKLYKISLAEDLNYSLPSFHISYGTDSALSPKKKEHLEQDGVSNNLQYLNRLRLLEKKKKIIICRPRQNEKNLETKSRSPAASLENSSNVSDSNEILNLKGKEYSKQTEKDPLTGNIVKPKIKRKVVLKKFYISESNQNQIKIIRVPEVILDNEQRFSKEEEQKSAFLDKQEKTPQYLLKVIGKTIYKIYRPKKIKTPFSNFNKSTNISSTNRLNIPNKKNTCRKPLIKRISSLSLSQIFKRTKEKRSNSKLKVFIKDIYKMYYLEPMKIKIYDGLFFDIDKQAEIKMFDVNKFENKNFRLSSVLPNPLFDSLHSDSNQNDEKTIENKNAKEQKKNGTGMNNNISDLTILEKNHVTSTNEDSLLKNPNVSRPKKKIPKREFYSFLDTDIQKFFYPDISPLTIEQYEKERKHELQTKKIFNKIYKINCQFEEKKYEYIKTGLLNFPQIVIIVGQQKEMKIIKECQKLNILTISISDSDGDPSLTNLFIPGNDDHPISVEYMLKHLAEAIDIGKIILNNLSTP
uniref:Small ribosomal subunit protein uS2c n=1 Tax=Trentepohlia odorata TaxID=2576626 RepID=A0A4Y5P3E9_9CHLO|nr:ribosomal protein S2 [Trentepohlia odorata]QCW57789.1 ribosomal protein S2 [Trentepohlia odorata]